MCDGWGKEFANIRMGETSRLPQILSLKCSEQLYRSICSEKEVRCVRAVPRSRNVNVPSPSLLHEGVRKANDALSNQSTCSTTVAIP